MTDRVLRMVANGDLKPRPAGSETVAQCIRRLQAEARQMAKDHVKALTHAMVDLEQLAAEIADGGEAYPAGIRDVCRRLVEDLEARVNTIDALAART